MFLEKKKLVLKCFSKKETKARFSLITKMHNTEGDLET